MRLINADELPVKKLLVPVGNYGEIYRTEVVHKEDLDNALTIEAEPVKHGRWLFNGMILNRQKCSVCGFYSDDLQADNYCPNCGARMDLKDGDNT